MRFDVVRVFGVSPRSGKVVFNAPRPLPGAERWIGPFVCGEHYATIDTTLPQSSVVLQDMADLRAVVLRYVTIGECWDRVRKHSDDRNMPCSDMEDDKIVQTALKLWHRDGETVEIVGR